MGHIIAWTAVTLRFMLALFALPFIAGGILNLLFPEESLAISRAFLSVLRLEGAAPRILMSVAAVKIAGIIALVVGLAILAAAMFLPID